MTISIRDVEGNVIVLDLHSQDYIELKQEDKSISVHKYDKRQFKYLLTEESFCNVRNYILEQSLVCNVAPSTHEKIAAKNAQ